ncbi:MAG: DUF1905 domain-containing protein [Cellulomonadaceae bacterium]|jgi:hypothetical protein|nr:DUF1905 domain-containing protein [Cellulomonadaceae bacterium]
MVRIWFDTVLESQRHGRAQIWLVRVPEEESDLLADLPIPRGGFGSVKVNATICDSTWRTSVFPDRSQYLLLVARKLALREGLAVGDSLRVELEIIGT